MHHSAKLCQPTSPCAIASLEEIFELMNELRTRFINLAAARGRYEVAVAITPDEEPNCERLTNLHAMLKYAGISVSLQRGTSSSFLVYRLDPVERRTHAPAGNVRGDGAP